MGRAGRTRIGKRKQNPHCRKCRAEMSLKHSENNVYHLVCEQCGWEATATDLSKRLADEP